ncbi:MAG: glycosyltransferase [Ruminococcaceae bacterium]|nr:glycosyltransferase [Oscillospiraceae bacterium]
MKFFDFSKEPGQVLHKKTGTGVPLLSIITGFYNAAEHFEQTFNSVMNQTFPWFEWVIVNDGSTRAEDVAYMENLAQTDARIRVIHQENGGLSAARNKAIEASKTDIVLPLDADDLLEPTALEMLYWALLANPQASWSYCDVVGFGGQYYQWKKPFNADKMRTENLLVATAAIRKQAVLEVGGYLVADHHINEDWVLWLELLARGHFPVHVNQYAFWYRRQESGMLSSIHKDKELQKTAARLVAQKAALIKEPEKIVPVEYPLKRNYPAFTAPVVDVWEHRVDRDTGKIHVTFVFPWLEMGGADLFNLNLIAGLDRNRYAVSILLTQAAAHTWRSRFEAQTDEIFFLPDFLDIDHMAAFFHYYLQTRQSQLLFVSNSALCYGLVPWIKTQFPGLPVVDYVHMEEWYWRNGGHARSSGQLGGILTKTYVCNENTRKVLLDIFGRHPDTVETVYIGVDETVFDPQTVPAGQVYQEFSLAEGRPIVLFPCRMAAQKRPFLMLEIAKQMKAHGSPVAFVAVGDGPDSGALEAAARQMGLRNTVYFAGRRSDMRPFYKDAAVTLICSVKEGLALTAYESLAMAVPVVTSDVGGQAELVNDSCGRVVPLLVKEEDYKDDREFLPEEIDLYEKALNAVLGDAAQHGQMCENGRKRILSGFSLHRMQSYFNAELARVANAAAEQPLVVTEGLANMATELAMLAAECEKGFSRAFKADVGMVDSKVYRLAVRILNFLNYHPLGFKIGRILRPFSAKEQVE